jgi:hypothetical protein
VKSKTETTITAACGEYFVAAYLSGYELIVALPRAGVPGCDMLVTKTKGGFALRFQVKTGTSPRNKSRKWGEMYRWSTSCTVHQHPHLWYAYVALNGWPRQKPSDGQIAIPEVFFVPSSVVAKVMADEAEASWSYFWLNVDKAEQYRGGEGMKSVLAAFDEGAVKLKT